MGQFVPNIVVLNILKELGMRNEKLEREVPKMVRECLIRIYDEQNYDGGWGWFKGDITHRFMTAYVVYGLALAQQMGFDVDQKCIQRGIEALWRLIRSENTPSLKAYMLFALTEAKAAWGKLAGSEIEMRKIAQTIVKASSKSALPPMAHAVLTIALSRLDEKTLAQQSLNALEKQARFVDRYCFWEGTWCRLGESDVEATAYALKALLSLKPNDPKVTGAVLWLMLKRTGNFWYSTKSTAVALLALTDYITRFREFQANYSLKVFVNGDIVHEQHITTEHIPQGEIVLTVPASVGENKVTIQKMGIGRVYYTVLLRGFVTKGMNRAEGNLLTVQRRYLVKDKRGKWIPLGSEVRIGTDVAVQLTITAKQNLEYVMVEDPLPSGWEVVQYVIGVPAKVEGLPSDWWTKTEIHDDRMALFMTYMPKGTHHFSYLLRPEIEGTQTALPPVAQIMYRPQLRGRGVGVKLTVHQ